MSAEVVVAIIAVGVAAVSVLFAFRQAREREAIRHERASAGGRGTQRGPGPPSLPPPACKTNPAARLSFHSVSG
jgi:hypothetical protein